MPLIVPSRPTDPDDALLLFPPEVHEETTIPQPRLEDPFPLEAQSAPPRRVTLAPESSPRPIDVAPRVSETRVVRQAGINVSPIGFIFGAAAGAFGMWMFSVPPPLPVITAVAHTAPATTASVSQALANDGTVSGEMSPSVCSQCDCPSGTHSDRRERRRRSRRKHGCCSTTSVQPSPRGVGGRDSAEAVQRFTGVAVRSARSKRVRGREAGWINARRLVGLARGVTCRSARSRGISDVVSRDSSDRRSRDTGHRHSLPRAASLERFAFRRRAHASACACPRRLTPPRHAVRSTRSELATRSTGAEITACRSAVPVRRPSQAASDRATR